jgi:hypothetical protein
VNAFVESYHFIQVFNLLQDVGDPDVWADYFFVYHFILLGDALIAFEKSTGGNVVTEKNFKQQVAEARPQKRLLRKS